MSEKKSSTALEVRDRNRKLIERVCICGVLIALSIVAKLFLSTTIPFLGPGGMNIGLTGVFSAFPALLFGGIYGGVTSALCDIIGHFVKPDGAYIPWLSMTAFLGGFLKGLLFKISSAKKIGKKVLVSFLAVFLVIAALGVFLHVTVTKDGVLNGFFPKIENVPSKGALSAMEVSPLTDGICSLAKYNKDTLTLTVVPDTDTVILPVISTTDGTVTKLGAYLFASETIKTVYIPSVYKSMDASAFCAKVDGKNVPRTDIIVYVTKDAPIESALKDNKIGYLYAEEPDVSSFCEITVDTPDTFSAQDYSWKSSNTFRKYLAGYMSFATVGLELAGIIGIIVVVLCFFLQNKQEKADGTEKARFSFQDFGRIAFALTVSGVIVTTINTFILRETMAAWAGRAFMILWIPRLIEEIIVCILQSYLVTLLYEFYKVRIAPKFRF